MGAILDDLWQSVLDDFGLPVLDDLSSAAPSLLTDNAGTAVVPQVTIVDETGAPLTNQVDVELDIDIVSQNPLTTQVYSTITDESGYGLEFEVVTPIPLSPRGWQVFYAMDLLPYEVGGGGHLRASDIGYRTLPSDDGGVQVYPPALETAFEIDRLVSIDPGSDSTATFGSVRLNNLPLEYDDYITSRNSDSRFIQINVGLKPYDRARGVYVDPSYNSLATLFSGYAMPWKLSEEQLEIPLRDVTYWADRPIQTALYSGSGKAEGGQDLAGKPKPMVRGGTADAPVRNVPLVLVDAVNLVYQWTDGPGTIVNLYEGGAAVFSYDGTVPPLLALADPTAIWNANQPAPGHYYTDNSRGFVRMGSSPVNQLTADVTGAFPISGFKITPASIARYLLSETLGQPDGMMDLASFIDADTISVGPLTTEADTTLTDESDAPLEYDTDPANPPYTAGFFVGATDTRALDILNLLAKSVGARLIPNRNGSLKLLPLRQMPTGTAPKVLLTTQNVIQVTPQALSKNLDPPTSLWKVGYSLNNTVMTSGLNGSVSAARKAVLANTYQYSTWSDPTVDAQYPSSNKPPPVQTYLLLSVGAAEIADDLGDLFGTRASYYAVEVPMDIAANLEIGDFVKMTWPLGNLRTGQVGQIIGEQIRSYDASATLSVLVSGSTP